MAERSIPDLVKAYPTGGEEVKEELLTRLEPVLRGFVRREMGHKLRTMEESLDLCQSVLFAFHLRADAGKIEVEDESALRGYLRAMLRNKLANRADMLKAVKRGGGKRPASLDSARDEKGELQLPAFDPTVSMAAGVAELNKKLQSELDTDEMAILEGRLAGCTNPEIAVELGASADAIRMRWKRVRDRLVRNGLLADPGPSDEDA